MIQIIHNFFVLVHMWLSLTLIIYARYVFSKAMNVGPCHHGMARPRVADGGTASNMEGSCE